VRALVTGASGFIGRALTRVLVDAGDNVTCLVRESSNRAPLEALGVRFAVGDVTQPESLVDAAVGVDVVFHLAAMLAEPWHPDFLRTNALGVRHILDACAAVKAPPRVVLTSSMAAAGPSPDGPRTEDDPPDPVSRYGASKLAGEAAAREYADRVPVTIVRPPVVFGPGDTAMLPAFRAARRGIGVVYNRAAFSMIHVDDLARLLRTVALSGAICARAGSLGRGVYFGADEQAPTARELWALLGRAMGRTVRVLPVPSAVVHVAGLVAEAAGRLGASTLLSRDKTAEATAGSWVCSTAKARGLGWSPAAPLDARLSETGAWYRAQGML